MTFLKYEDWNPSAARLAYVDMINVIIEEYQKQGLDMTLRQVYYQLVARGKIENNDEEYDRLGDTLKRGRMAGLISWDAIVDRGRSLKGLQTWTHPRQMIEGMAAKYRRDLWEGQQWRPEVWVEKQALEGVIAGICNELRVDFFSCKGYNSVTEQWNAGRRFANYVQKGQRPIVFHFGDRDPSGVDMTRDNRERLEVFAGVPVTVVRLALNRDQVDELQPPPNPLKMKGGKLSDARAKAYVEMRLAEEPDCDPYVSWELDALEPSYIRDLIRKNVDQIRDDFLWDQALLTETEDRRWMEEL